MQRGIPGVIFLNTTFGSLCDLGRCDARIAANVSLVGVDSHGGMATLATHVQRIHEVGLGVVSTPSAVRLWPANQTS